MEESTESFNLQNTVRTVWDAVGAVICHILFDAGIQGLLVAFVILLSGLVLIRRGHRFGKPLLFASKRLALLCLCLLVPGAICFALSGSLPDAGVYKINALGYIVFWSMVSVHMCAEEMNFQWWVQGPPPPELGAEETEDSENSHTENSQDSDNEEHSRPADVDPSKVGSTRAGS